MTKEQLYKLMVDGITQIQDNIGNGQDTNALMATEYLHGIIKAYCEEKE